MKASQFYISTLKEAPADAEIVSHQLMTRAGMIKKLGAGIYTYMPMGLRVIRKVEAIVREEMNRAGAVECVMPVVQPGELWSESGRFQTMGPELMRVKDRHERDFVVQPTSEEAVTDIARQDLRSYKQLPRNLYQIQTKFRDERRPRFGLMRGREFIMKDAYSFDRDEPGAKKSYQVMAQAYRAIFDRFGLRYRAVAADSGAIGGDLSEEFQVIAATGEDAIVYCPGSDYAANMEKAEALAPAGPRPQPAQAMAKVPTPGKATCAEVAELLGLPLARTVKSLVLATDKLDEQGAVAQSQIWLLLLRGDHDMNEIKASKVPGLNAGFRFATVPEIVAHFGTPPGYLGPIGLKLPVRVVADREVAMMADWVCGANEADFHLTGVNWGRDLPEPDVVADLRNVVAGDASPDGNRARHRDRPHLLPGHQVQPRHGRHLPGRGRQAQAVRDGLLRHRHHAAAGGGHRAEPRRARHRLARRHRALHRRHLPGRHGPQRIREGRRRAPVRRAAGRWRGRDPGRPRRTPGRDVCRLGVDRCAAPCHHW